MADTPATTRDDARQLACSRCGGERELITLGDLSCPMPCVACEREQEARNPRRLTGAQWLEVEDARRRAAAREEKRLSDFDTDLGARYRRYNWRTDPAGREPAQEAAAEWLDSWLDSGASRNLYLHGPAGEGKTGLAVALGREQIAYGCTVRFFVGREWLESIKRSFAGDGDSAELEDAARNPQLLILDDLGSERATPFALERLLGLIDHRYRHELPTIVSSNFAPSALVTELGKVDETVGERIVSRLVEDAVKVRFAYGNLRLRAEAPAA
jgi:DNA replication protein DnaC